MTGNFVAIDGIQLGVALAAPRGSDAGVPSGTPASSCPLAAWSSAVRRSSRLLLAAWLVRRAQRSRSDAGSSPSPTLTEQPGVTLEGTGFTGAEVRGSFDLAVRQYPIDLVFYDNQRDDARAVANAEAAIARKVDLYIQYHRGSGGQRHRRAEAEGRGHSRARGQLSGARRAALQRRTTRRPVAWPGRRWPSSPRASWARPADGRRGHRAACRTPGRSRAGAGPGRDGGAAQAAARRAADDARHAGQSGPGRSPAGQLSRRASPRARS